MNELICNGLSIFIYMHAHVISDWYLVEHVLCVITRCPMWHLSIISAICVNIMNSLLSLLKRQWLSKSQQIPVVNPYWLNIVYGEIFALILFSPFCPHQRADLILGKFQYLKSFLFKNSCFWANLRWGESASEEGRK